MTRPMTDARAHRHAESIDKLMRRIRVHAEAIETEHPHGAELLSDLQRNDLYSMSDARAVIHTTLTSIQARA